MIDAYVFTLFTGLLNSWQPVTSQGNQFMGCTVGRPVTMKSSEVNDNNKSSESRVLTGFDVFGED